MRSLETLRTVRGRLAVEVEDVDAEHQRPSRTHRIVHSNDLALSERKALCFERGTVGDRDCGEWNPDRLVQQIVTRAVDGVLVAVDLHPWDAYRKALSNLPVVTCDQALSDTDFPAVYIEHRQAARDGLTHLYEQGARRIVCVGVGEARVCSSNVLRVGAYRQFAAEEPHKIRVTYRLIQRGTT